MQVDDLCVATLRGVYRHIAMRTIVFCMVWFTLIPANPGFAHRIIVFAEEENGMVHVEGYFPDGKKCADAKVEVLNSKGEKVTEGKTDKDGRFLFKAEKTEDLNIILNASMGHRAEFLLKGSERGDSTTLAHKVVIERGQNADRDSGRISFKDIVSGLGYIFGIMGILMYVKSRKK
ncbi:MAG: hypothetical protein V1753_02475 [Pseudomonadota bacterium]